VKDHLHTFVAIGTPAMTKRLLTGWVFTAIGLLLISAANAQLPGQLPTVNQNSGNLQTLVVPTALSGIQAGNSETAVDVNEAPTVSQSLPGPAVINAVANQASDMAGSLRNVAIEGSLDPSTLPATLASSTSSDQGFGSSRTSANTVSFGNSDGNLRKIPDIQTLTAATQNPLAPKSGFASSGKNSEMTSFHSVGPTIRVETVGPRSISVNKPASYEIRISNTGKTEARGINISTGFPSHIELMSAQPTTGTHTHTPENESAGMNWRIESLAAGRTESVIMNLTPREAKLFDLQVSWATDLIRGNTSIEVSEPKLEMKIAGPADVHYGEKAIYTVTIRNPGTGTAEDVEIMLSEQLGGQRAAVGDILPNTERSFEVELVPGEAGNLMLEAFATSETLEHSVAKEIMVRRANLEISAQGAATLYAGTDCTYNITVRNNGDAIARDVIAAAVLPVGATYLSGVEGADQVDTGLRWNIGTMAPDTERTYKINCTLNQPGDMRLEAGVRGSGDLAATNIVSTRVEALADIVLVVEDPKGPLPIDQDMAYTVRVKNRGSKAAYNIQIAMQFSEGLEPVSASGNEYQIEPGQISFREIPKIEVGQEIMIKIVATASESGSHRFRAVLNCIDPKTEEIAQGTTKFYGPEITTSVAQPSTNEGYPTGGTLDSSLRR